MRPFIRKLAISPVFWLAFSGAMLALHFEWARNTHDGANLARCGALWAAAAGALLARPVIRLGYTEWVRSTHILGGGPFKPSADQEEELREHSIDLKCIQVIAPALIVAGTILWGYGDLLGHWLFTCHCR